MSNLFHRVSSLVLGAVMSSSAFSFELLSEGAMGTVSAVSADSVEEIVNIAGPTAAGLTVDDDYEELPFQSNIVIEDANPEEVTDQLEFSLTQEVETWANSVNVQGPEVNNAVGYIDELPPSEFEDSAFIQRDDEFDSIIFDSDDQEDEANFELSRIEDAFENLTQGLETIRFVVERKVDFVATIAPEPEEGQAPSVGSGFISDLTSISNVRIATVRD
jgi:hypothetical protein